jgi:hypothetical protein
MTGIMWVDLVAYPYAMTENGLQFTMKNESLLD